MYENIGPSTKRIITCTALINKVTEMDFVAGIPIVKAEKTVKYSFIPSDPGVIEINNPKESTTAKNKQFKILIFIPKVRKDNWNIREVNITLIIITIDEDSIALLWEDNLFHPLIIFIKKLIKLFFVLEKLGDIKIMHPKNKDIDKNKKKRG
jgi:hypothetical protein